MSKKKCNKCEIEKSLDQFYKGNAGQGVSSWCKECSKKHDKERRSKKSYKDSARKSVLLRVHGLSEKDTKRLFNAQGKKCAICGITE